MDAIGDASRRATLAHRSRAMQRSGSKGSINGGSSAKTSDALHIFLRHLVDVTAPSVHESSNNGSSCGTSLCASPKLSMGVFSGTATLKQSTVDDEELSEKLTTVQDVQPHMPTRHQSLRSRRSFHLTRGELEMQIAYNSCPNIDIDSVAVDEVRTASCAAAHIARSNS